MSYTYISTALRRVVQSRANGKCEYCKVPEELALVAFSCDHIISEKAGGETKELNLAYACLFCNRAKGASIASFTGQPPRIVPLYNPREDRWGDHFSFLRSGEIEGKTEVGEGTIFMLKMNAPRLVSQRKSFFEDGVMEVG